MRSGLMSVSRTRKAGGMARSLRRESGHMRALKTSACTGRKIEMRAEVAIRRPEVWRGEMAGAGSGLCNLILRYQVFFIA